ncbi:MAG: GNAT family N-acetyltransferase [DPANN group archaeon]|nr:GNAT family N-acetyltransferase [DPANN group archaeon]
MEITEINDLKGLQALEPEWKALLDNSYSATFFQSPEWIITWTKHFLDDRKLRVLVAREQGELVGIAPLFMTLQREGVTNRTIKFLGDPLTDYNDYIIHNDYVDKVLEGFCGHLHAHADEWNRLQLREMPGESKTLAYIKKKHRASLPVKQEETFRFRISEEDGSVGEIMERVEKKITERRGRLKKFIHSQAYSAGLAKDYAEFLSFMERLKAFHIRRWADTSTPSYFTDPKHVHFFEELHRLLWDRGMINLSVVRRQGEVIATILCYLYQDQCYYYTSSYSWEAKNISPSHANFLSTIGFCIERGFHTFDFGRGDESFKREYANHICRNYSIDVVNKPVLMPLLKAKQLFLGSLRENPRLYRKAKQVKEFLGIMHKSTVG